MKENGRGWFTWLTGGRTYKEEKFGDDAEMVIEHYRDNGYIAAQVGQPDLKVLEDEEDGKTRWVQLRVPITEGDRYKIGEFSFEGNTVVKADALKGLFKFDQGEYYSEKKIKKSLDKAREVYGAGGYYEFVAYPDLKPRNVPAADGNGANGPPAPSATAVAAAAKEPAVVDVTMKVTEGKQYFVNRITFTGNTTTRDNVIRREIRLLEAGVFNTEALKYSIKRLNQLGYFKALEGDAINVEKTPGVDNKVDLVAEARGAEPQPADVRRRRVAVRRLLRAAVVPDLELPRPRRNVQHHRAAGQPRQELSGGVHRAVPVRPADDGRRRSLHPADPLHRACSRRTPRAAISSTGSRPGSFSRVFVNYSLERSTVKDLNPLYNDLAVLQRNPFLQDSLLIGLGGKRTISKVSPSWVFNTVDQPIFPTSGTRYTLGARRRRARRQHELPQAADRGYLVHPAQQAHLARLPRRIRLHPAVGQHAGAADLRAAVSRRRIQHPRLRHPDGGAARSGNGHRARRHQEPAVQRGVPDPHRRPGAAGAVRRRRPGSRQRPQLRLVRRQDPAHRCRGS